MPTKLKTIQTRATPGFIEFLKTHLEATGWDNSIGDYVLAALVDKLASETDAPIPLPKAPHGVRMDARPNGWLSRLYPDQYELIVLNSGDGPIVSHLHEASGQKPYPHTKQRFEGDVNSVFVKANIYIAGNVDTGMQEGGLGWGIRPQFEDSPVGLLVAKFIAEDMDKEDCK